MNLALEPRLRSTISHAALSAGIAFSLSSVADDASAQQAEQRSNIALDTVEVEVEGQTPGDGSYVVQTASSGKQTAPLVDTPQTVTIIPQAVIRERNARNLTEVLRNTPGITFDAGENAFSTSTDNFKLRGFDTSGSIFIDGARDNGSYGRDTFNVDRVEVFKGPASDNGRGGAGGYINMVTKSPLLQNFVAGEVGVGFDDYRSKIRKRTTVDANYTVTPNTAFRVNGMWEDGGIAGREIAESKAWGIAPSIAFGLGTNARAIFSYEHLTRRDRPDWGVPAATMPGMFTYNSLAAGARRDAYYGLRSDFDNVEADTVLARFEYDFANNAKITNQTRWSRVDRRARFTPMGNNAFVPPSTVNTTTMFYDRENNTLSNLTNYTAEFFTGAVKHGVSMGLELSQEKSQAGRFGTVNSPTDLFNPNPDRIAGPPFNPTQQANVKVDTIAAYLYDTIELNKNWQITGGLRAERYKVTIDDSQNTSDFSGSFTTLGGKIGLVYKPVENGSFYVSYGLAHQPPGSYLSTSDISRTGDNAFPGLIPDADPIRSQNYEVGTKWEFFNKRLQVSAALFRTEKRVPITGCMPADFNNPTAGCAVGAPIDLQGYGKQIAQGLELGVAGELARDWKVFGGLLWMKTERQHSAALDSMRMAAQPGDYPVGFRSGTSGDELAFSPRFSANLWSTYRLPDTGWTIGGGVQYVGSSFVGRPDDAERIIPNGRYGKLPGYFLTHLMAVYEVRKDVELRLNVDNVFDKTYVVSTNWPAQRALLGASRTYRMSASFRF